MSEPPAGDERALRTWVGQVLADHQVADGSVLAELPRGPGFVPTARAVREYLSALGVPVGAVVCLPGCSCGYEVAPHRMSEFQPGSPRTVDTAQASWCG